MPTGEQSNNPETRRPAPAESTPMVDPVRQYLKEIGRVPLLTAEEEIELGQKIQAGLVASERMNELLADETGILPRAERRELQTVIKQGQIAKDHMIEANLRLVVSVAKRYAGGLNSLELLDLIQEGSIGLNRAAEKFDPDRGFKFSTYATWWIRQAITRSIADSDRVIRVPVHMNETLMKFVREEKKLINERVENIDDELIAMGYTHERISQLRLLRQTTLSLDQSVGEDEGDFTLGDTVPDITQQLLLENFDPLIFDAWEKVIKLSNLNERERKILYDRIILEKTLDEIGREMNVTRERIRQVESKAKTKIRIRTLRDPETFAAILGHLYEEKDRLTMTKGIKGLGQANTETTSLTPPTASSVPNRATNATKPSNDNKQMGPKTPPTPRKKSAPATQKSRGGPLVIIPSSADLIQEEAEKVVRYKPDKKGANKNYRASVRLAELSKSSDAAKRAAEKFLGVELVFFESASQMEIENVRQQALIDAILAEKLDHPMVSGVITENTDFLQIVAYGLKGKNIPVIRLKSAQEYSEAATNSVGRALIEQRKGLEVIRDADDIELVTKGLKRYIEGKYKEEVARSRTIANQITDEIKKGQHKNFGLIVGRLSGVLINSLDYSNYEPIEDSSSPNVYVDERMQNIDIDRLIAKRLERKKVTDNELLEVVSKNPKAIKANA